MERVNKKILQKTMMMTIKTEINGIVILTIAMALDKVVYAVIKIVKNVLIVVEWFVNNHHNKNSKNNNHSKTDNNNSKNDKDNSKRDNDNSSKKDNDNSKKEDNNSNNEDNNSNNDNNSSNNEDNSNKEACASMSLKADGTWDTRSCDETLPFPKKRCYDKHVCLII